tara:strand:- start:1865 stop:3994 length:2130 start_codon:yes stop_codon:yes gene_type:complete
MATVFASPEVGSAEATPPRNGGIRQRTRDIVYPVSTCTGAQFTPGKRVEFRFRSDSSRFVSFRDTNLVVKLETKFIPARQSETTAADRQYTSNKHCLRNLRFTAAPATALFAQGMQYQCNSVTIENQPHPYEAAMLNLITKGDAYASMTSASNSMLDLAKACEVDRKRFQDGWTGLTLTSQSKASILHAAANTVVVTGVTGVNFDAFFNTILSISNAQRAELVAAAPDDNPVGMIVHFPTYTATIVGLGAADSGIDEHGVAVNGTTAVALRFERHVGGQAGGFTGTFQPARGIIGKVYNGEGISQATASVDAYQTKPKHEMLTSRLVQDESRGGFTAHTELSEPVQLQSWRHGWACPGADHQLFLEINNKWNQDLFYEASEVPEEVQHLLYSDDPNRTEQQSAQITNQSSLLGHQFNQVVAGQDEFPAHADLAINDAGFIITRVTSVELHVGYVSPLVPFVPRSVSWAWSSIDVQMVPVQSTRIMESIVIKPSVRLVVLGMRQNKHGIHMDREEMGKAGAKLIELGEGESWGGHGANAANGIPLTPLIAPNALNHDLELNPDYLTSEFNTLEVRCGSESKPSPAYTALDIDKGTYARPYADMIQALGKNFGLRGSCIAFNDYIGAHSANNVDTGNLQFAGDRGPLFFIPLLLPSGSLQNVLTIDATLKTKPGRLSEQELVILTVNDELWNMKYAPPAELPLSTTSRQLL